MTMNHASTAKAFQQYNLAAILAPILIKVLKWALVVACAFLVALVAIVAGVLKGSGGRR